MASNYQVFSEIIEKLTTEESKWVFSFLCNYEDRGTDEEDLRKWCEDRGLDFDSGDYDYWPSFSWKIESNRDLWLYAEENFDLDNLMFFVHTFLKKFRPLDAFYMTYATYCSKPRIGEFSGGWACMTAYGYECGNAYSAVEELKKRMAGRVELEVQAKQAAARIPD